MFLIAVVLFCDFASGAFAKEKNNSVNVQTATYVSEETVIHASSHSAIHINDIIPRKRQKIIVELAKKLKRFPNMQAYLIAGSKIEPDGSRMIMTVSNSASRKIGIGMNPSNGQAIIEFGYEGIRILRKTFLEKGIPGGYQDNVFYQLNWDIDILGRDTIISLGNSIQRGR